MDCDLQWFDIPLEDQLTFTAVVWPDGSMIQYVHKHPSNYKGGIVPLPSERATNLVTGSRRETYGDPSPIAATAAEFWTTWLSIDGVTDPEGIVRAPTPTDVQMMMALHKIAREKHRELEDNRTDICGYVNIYEETLHGNHP